MSTTTSSAVRDRELERQGRRLGRTGTFWVTAGAAASLPGIVLVIVGFVAGITWLWAVGLALIALGGVPLIVGLTLVGSSAVTRWSARHKTFA